MPDDADDTTGSRPSLEAPRLFGRRRATSPVLPTEPTGDERVFEDSGLEATTQLPLSDDTTADATADATADDDEATPRPVQPPGARRTRRTRRTSGSTQVLDEAPPAQDDDEEPVVRRRSRPRLPSLPRVPRPSGRPAAVTAGLLAGLSLLGLTWLGFRGCEAVRGTSSCGAAPGMAALIVIFVLAVVVGGLLLAWWGVPDPGATSFLGTGLTGVISLLFLVDHLDTWPVLVAIPLITAATFLASWWVTTTYVEPA